MDINREPADLLLLNGKVVVMDGRSRVAGAIAIRDKRISMVGTTEEIHRLGDERTRRIDLMGKTVLPGFMDAHTHVDLVGMMNSGLVVDCHIPPRKSVADILERIREKTEATPKGNLILGQGRWTQPYPTREQLDNVAPDHPVIVKNTMHSYLLNTLALEKYRITRDRPTGKELLATDPGGIIYRNSETSEPTGRVDEAWNYMFPGSRSPFGYERTKNAIREGLNRYSRHGVTTITEFVDYSESIRIYQELHEGNELNVRLNIVPCIHGLHRTTDLDSVLNLGLVTGFGDEYIRFGGVKIFVDRQRETVLTSIELKEIVARAHRNGIRVFMHAESRKAQDMALEAIESAVRAAPGRSLRHRIEHMGNELIDLKYFDRVKDSGSIALPTAYFMNIVPSFPPGESFFLFRTMLEKGLCVPGNSDSGGTEPEAPNPLYQIWCMAERKSQNGEVVNPEECISVSEGLQIYTMHSAFANLEEQTKGSIESGKLADLAIFSKDPLASAVDEIRNIPVEMTIVGGKIVYERSS